MARGGLRGAGVARQVVPGDGMVGRGGALARIPVEPDEYAGVGIQPALQGIRLCDDAGIGGLAYAGIPVTHRDTNHAVTFLTGHGADGKLPDFDWPALARGGQTLVFYMARAQAGAIAAALISAGRPADEPAAILANATRADQAITLTRLDEMGSAAMASPPLSLLVVGANVRLAQTLDWLVRATLNPA